MIGIEGNLEIANLSQWQSSGTYCVIRTIRHDIVDAEDKRRREEGTL